MRLTELNESINQAIQEAAQTKSSAELAGEVLAAVNEGLPGIDGFNEFSDILVALEGAIRISQGEKHQSDKLFGIFGADQHSPATKKIISKINNYVKAQAPEILEDPEGREALQAAKSVILKSNRYKVIKRDAEEAGQDHSDERKHQRRMKNAERQRERQGVTEKNSHLRATSPKPKRQKAGGTKNPTRDKMVGEEIRTRMKRPTTTWFMEEIIGVDAAKKRDGVFRVARGFFYRSGGTPEAYAEKISKELDKMGVNHKILDSGEVYGTGFKGGASTWRQDHWWVDLEILNDKVPYSELVDEDLAEKKKAKCWKGYERVPGTEPYSKGSCRKK